MPVTQREAVAGHAAGEQLSPDRIHAGEVTVSAVPSTIQHGPVMAPAATPSENVTTLDGTRSG